MKLFILILFAVSIFISACAGSSPIISGSRTFKGQRPTAATLKVINDHAVDIIVDVNDREFGILAHSSVSIPARSGTEYRVRRKTFLNGDRGSDTYRFFIPEDSTSRTVVFGETQHGVVANHTGLNLSAKIATSSGFVSDWIESGTAAEFKLLPGPQLLVIKFSDGRIYEGPTAEPINDIRGDQYFVCCCVQSVILKFYVRRP